jgi:hypothetical protein
MELNGRRASMQKVQKLLDGYLNEDEQAAELGVVKRTLRSWRQKGFAESDDDYPCTVAFLNYRWRVIECRDRVQWILQYRAIGQKPSRDTLGAAGATAGPGKRLSAAAMSTPVK